MDAFTIDQRIASLNEDYKQAVSKVKRDKDLNDRGRAARLAALKEDRAKALKSYVPDLRTSAVEIALKTKHLQGALSALKSMEGEQWDYNHLAYLAQAVKSQIALCKGDVYEITQRWEATKKSGDRYAMRAFLDTAPSTFPEDGGNRVEEWSDLKADMVASSGLLISAEASAYMREKRNLLDSLAEVARTASSIGEELAEGSGYKGKNVVARVFKGIALDRSTDELVVDLGVKQDESADTVIQRLQTEDMEATVAQAKIFEAFGTPYDPILDGDGSLEVGDTGVDVGDLEAA